jgi:MATE family multidrug resistance protein
LLEIKQELIPSITTYSKIVVWSFPFGIAFQALKEYLQGFEDVFMPNLIAVIAIFFNVGVNYLFVFGYADFAGMGEVGLAWATFATRVMLFATLFIYILKKEGVSLIDWELIAEIFKFSLPIGFMFFLEVLAFCSVSMLSGKFDVNAAAANNVAMILSSIAFMIPMGLSGAVAVKVGHAYGKQNKHEIHEYTKASVILIGIVVSITVSLFTFMPETMMGLYTNDKNVIDIGVSILGIVAIFQLVDSLQVTFTGVLRGMKYTNEVTWMILIGYWFFGIPIGYYLSFHSNIGVSGLWIGLAIALFLVSAALITFYWRKYKKLKFHNVM